MKIRITRDIDFGRGVIFSKGKTFENISLPFNKLAPIYVGEDLFEIEHNAYEVIPDWSETDYEIIGEIYKAVEKLGGLSDILGTIGSWKDTLPDEDVLLMLKQWNEYFDNAKKQDNDNSN